MKQSTVEVFCLVQYLNSLPRLFQKENFQCAYIKKTYRKRELENTTKGELTNVDLTGLETTMNLVHQIRHSGGYF